MGTHLKRVGADDINGQALPCLKAHAATRPTGARILTTEEGGEITDLDYVIAPLPVSPRQALAKGLCQCWDHLEEVAHHAVVGHLEDGGLGVCVDSHNDPGGPHPSQVLDGS